MPVPAPKTISKIHHDTVLLVGLLEALETLDNQHPVAVEGCGAITSLIEIAGARARALADDLEAVVESA
jgi:hypothetical protein